MVAILDNLLAGIILATVVLVLLSTQLRAQRVSIDATVTFAGRTSATVVGDWIERDLATAGTNMEPTAQAVTDPLPLSGTDHTREFEFMQNIEDPSDPSSVLVQRVRYRLVPEGSRTDASGSYPLYRLTRAVATGSGSFTSAGSTPPLLRSFRVTLHDAASNLIPNVANELAKPNGSVRTIRVRYAMVPPLVTETMPLLSTQHSASVMLANTASGVTETIEFKDGQKSFGL